MATATTPTRRAASRSAAPSSSRSSRSNHRALSRSDIPSSPLARIIDGDIPIDPALLAEDDAELQDDLDAEGEVDDGVGYYMPPEDYYYPPAPPLADGYQGHHQPPPLAAPPPPADDAPAYLPDMPLASSSSQLVVPPANGHSNRGPSPASVASPLSTASNVPVKRKRGRPRKDPNAPPKPKTPVVVTPRLGTPRASVNGTVNKVGRPPKGSSTSHSTPRPPKQSTPSTPRPPKASSAMPSIHLQVTPAQQVPNGSAQRPITPETVCSLCGGTDVRNREGNREKMVSCVRCGRSGHPSCLGISNPEVVKKMRSYEWCCIECKPCEVCHDKGEDHKLLFCDGCDRGWHSYCLNPPLSAPPKGMWYCPMCTGDHKPAPSSSKSSLKVGSATPVPVSSSSRKGKGRAVEEDTPKPSVPRDRKKTAVDTVDHLPNGSSTSKLKQKVNGVRDRDRDKGKEKDRGDTKERGDKDRETDKEKKDRKRPRVQSPSDDPPTPIVVRLRVPSGSRKEVQVEEESEQVPYGGVLTGEDADTTNTKILESDKELFNKSLKASEARLGGPPPPLWDPTAMTASPGPPSRQSTPGPSRPTPSKATPSKATPAKATPAATPTPTPTPGNVTPLLGSRSLRDRVLLQQSASLNGVGGAAGVDAPPSGRPEKISKIRFGIYDIDTWYTAPYPEEYAQVPDGRLWLCEFCLKYMKSGFVAGRHRMKCKSRHPPGDEIYRDGAISVFEVDGRKNKIYCQNLCLLAKMFLDHKTLYYDVEPFLFYVMTEVDEMGARFVGYFSKEKRTPENNVSCIMTLPVRQRKGWGQLLIDFSYLLSKKEGRVGSPERPLSGLGALSYKSYWRLTVFKYLSTVDRRVTLEDISAATSMTLMDIYTTLREAEMIKLPESAATQTPLLKVKPRRGRPPKIPRPVEYIAVAPGPPPKLDENKIPERYEIVPDMAVIEAALQKHNAKGYLTLRPERLKYTPFLVSRDPLPQPPIAAAVTGDRTAVAAAERPRIPSGTPSSGNKEVIATPADHEVMPITPDTKDKVAAGEDQATLDLVAALSASPVRHLRRRSIASSERPTKRRRSESTTSSRRRRSTHDLETPTRASKPKSAPPRSSRRVFEDPDDDEAWGEEDAEGEDDDEEYVEVDDD